MRDYLDYLENIREYGGQPITQEEFEILLQEEKEMK